MHREETDLEAGEHERKAPAAEALVEHPTGHLREPVVKRGEDWKEICADEHVMQMRDDKVGVVHLPIERDDGGDDAGEATDDEAGEKAEHEIERRRAHRLTEIERGQPGEDLNRRKERDGHARGGEE